MKGLSFRGRISIWSTLLAAIVLLVSGVCAAFVLYHRACAQLREEMEAESAHFFAQMHERGTANFPWSTIGAALREWMPPENTPRLIEVYTADGTLRYRSKELDDPGFGKHSPGLVNVSLKGQTVMLMTSVQEGVTFSIGSDLSETSDLMVGLAVSLVAALPVALLIAWLGGRWLAARAVQPVVKITDAAESVTAQRLDLRVPVPTEKDEIQRLATVLNTTLDRLATSYAQAIRFSADASHELKTPLTVLRTSIEALLDSASLALADRAAVAGLLEQTQRLSRITNSLLLLARADAGQLILDVEEHDLSTLTAGCAEDARIMAEGRSLAFECVLPTFAPARVDAMRYSQIVSNLLVNAVKYNRAGGMVRLTLTESGGQWRLRVANTGQGIAPLVQERLFERFFREEHYADEQGEGLGLSLARELAHAHGGDIVLVASDSHWTEFLLTLPKAGPGLTMPVLSGLQFPIQISNQPRP